MAPAVNPEVTENMPFGGFIIDQFHHILWENSSIMKLSVEFGQKHQQQTYLRSHSMGH